MSLQETSLISILERLSNNTLSLDPNLSPYYVNMISEYTSLDIEDAFEKSVSDNKFQLADYFLSKIPIDQKRHLIIDAMRYQAHIKNRMGIDYLIHIGTTRYGLRLSKMLNDGLYGAIKGGNSNRIDWSDPDDMGLNLINWFIVQGANNMEFALKAAIEINDRILIQYFIDRGAVDWQSALETTATVSNLELVDYFAQLLGINNINYTKPLALAYFVGKLEIIQYLLDLQAQTILVNDMVYVGPVLMRLIEKLNFNVPYDYSSLVPLCKQGYISKTSVKFLLDKYVYENKLNISYLLPFYNNHKVTDNPDSTFIMDDFLKEILVQTSALYDVIPENTDFYVDDYENHQFLPNELIPNTLSKSSMEIIDNGSNINDYILETKFGAFDLSFIAHSIGSINIYKYDDLPEEIDDALHDPVIINQVIKERILFHIMYNIPLQ